MTQNSHSLDLIRAGFVAKGTSLHAWCRLNGVDPHNARKAIIGKRAGPKAVALVARIKAASLESGTVC